MTAALRLSKHHGLGNDFLITLDPERELSHRLDDVCARYGIVNERAHDARYDARATAQVLPHLLAAHGVDGPDDLDPLYER